MKKVTFLFVTITIAFLVGYAMGGKHHVPPFLILDDAVELLLVERQSASMHSQSIVLPVSYDPKQTQTDKNEGPAIKLIRKTYGDVLKMHPGQEFTHEETWTSCVEGQNVKLSYKLFEDVEQNHIVIDTVKAK